MTVDRQQAVFVLIHGGGHGGWCYRDVAAGLRANGHLVYAPSLPGMGEHQAQLNDQIDLDCHIDDVVALLHFEDLHNVILVGHSYGGMVITGVADRAADRVGHRVYLDAAYPQDGESLHQHAFEMIDAAKQGLYVRDGVELVMDPALIDASFFGVSDPDQIVWANARFTPQPWACFSQPLRLCNEARMRAIPESHLICTSTMVGRDMDLLLSRSEGRVWDVDTGHDLMITEPEWVVEHLERVAALAI